MILTWKFCPYCSTALESAWKFCPRCGNLTNATTSVSDLQAAQQAAIEARQADQKRVDAIAGIVAGVLKA